MPDDDFVIGEPVEELPKRAGREGSGRYRVIYARLEQTKDGSWLPVVCKDNKSARYLAASALGNRTKRMAARVRGTTAYLRIEEGPPRRS